MRYIIYVSHVAHLSESFHPRVISHLHDLPIEWGTLCMCMWYNWVCETIEMFHIHIHNIHIHNVPHSIVSHTRDKYHGRVISQTHFTLAWFANCVRHQFANCIRDIMYLTRLTDESFHRLVKYMRDLPIVCGILCMWVIQRTSHIADDLFHTCELCHTFRPVFAHLHMKTSLVAHRDESCHTLKMRQVIRVTHLRFRCDGKVDYLWVMSHL